MADISIDRALTDPALLGSALGEAKSWAGWLTILRAAFGLALKDEERAFFRQVAGDREPPSQRVRELWAICGRRSGKSRMAAAIAAYLATFHANVDKLAKGETGHVLVLAASKNQARTVFGYVHGFLDASPILRQQIEDVTAEEIRLAGGIVIGVHSGSFRSIRGRTVIAAILDESAFWRSEESVNPDVETYRAILPSLATTGGMLVGISSPYAQRGLLFEKSERHFGEGDPDVLVIRAPSQRLNPTLDEAVIAAARRDDPDAAASEWDAEFRADLSTFVERTTVERCVDTGVQERPFMREHRYVAFVDPSGGQHDSMTLAIAHREGQRVILDSVREFRAPFEPPIVVAEFARLIRMYEIGTVFGDRYAGQWVVDAFRQHSVLYVASERNRSEIYLDALPMLMSRECLLLDNRRLISQLAQLERRVGRSGRDSVDHMRGMQDDLANAAMGALVHCPSVTRWNDRGRRQEVAYGTNDWDPWSRYNGSGGGENGERQQMQDTTWSPW